MRIHASNHASITLTLLSYTTINISAVYAKISNTENKLTTVPQNTVVRVAITATIISDTRARPYLQ